MSMAAVGVARSSAVRAHPPVLFVAVVLIASLAAAQGYPAAGAFQFRRRSGASSSSSAHAVFHHHDATAVVAAWSWSHRPQRRARRLCASPQARDMTKLFAAARAVSLRPASASLMESGKQLAASGELLIEWTEHADLYGGGVSAAGAQIRNAGDGVAQAAASCRFQTGQELVCDELRAAADCLAEASRKLGLAVEEADVDKQPDLRAIAEMCGPLTKRTSDALERAGAGIMQNRPIPDIAQALVDAGQSLLEMSPWIGRLGSVASDEDGDDKASAAAGDASRRMLLAGEKMVEAGRELLPRAAAPDAKPAGKRWIKGGG